MDAKDHQNASRDSLYRFFHQNLTQAFADLQLANRQAIDYIASVLTDFARTEHLYRIRQIPKFKFESVVETLLEVETARFSDEPLSENEEVLIRKHVGDFTLFMSGIFREWVQRIGSLDFYLHEGSRSYHRVYDFASRSLGHKADIFADLSRRFENYSSALDYLKKVYFYYPNIDEKIKQLLNRLLQW